MLYSKTLAVNVLGMLEIPRQNTKIYVTLQLKFLYYFVQSRHLEKLTFMEFQHSTCFTFRGTHSQCFIILSKSFSSDALNTASLEILRQEQSTTQQFRLTPRTEQQCVQFYQYNELPSKYRANILLNFNTKPTPFILTKCRHTIQIQNLSVRVAMLT